MLNSQIFRAYKYGPNILKVGELTIKKSYSQESAIIHPTLEVISQCYRIINLRHLKKGNIFGNFNDFKLFQAFKNHHFDHFLKKVLVAKNH